MNIAIKKDHTVDVRDVVRRSSFANVPGAEETLRECLDRSVKVHCGFVDNEVACVWGLIPPTILSDNAWLWLLTTEIAAQHKFLLVRYSQMYIEEALREFPVILGDCDVSNTSARKWLKWLGAEFGPIVGGKIPFVIRAKEHELR